MAKSYPIFQLTSKDLTFFFKIEDKKFRAIISQREVNAEKETVFKDILSVDLKDDIQMYMLGAIDQIKKATEPKSISAVHSEWVDKSYKAKLLLTFNRTATGGYSLTVTENGKGSYEFPISTIAAVTFGGVPSKEEERANFGLEKIRLKLNEAFRLFIEANSINKGGNNFSQGGFNNKGNQGYQKFSNSGKGY